MNLNLFADASQLLFDLLNAMPFIQVLGLSGQHIHAFKYVDDVVNATTLNAKLFSALV